MSVALAKTVGSTVFGRSLDASRRSTSGSFSRVLANQAVTSPVGVSTIGDAWHSLVGLCSMGKFARQVRSVPCRAGPEEEAHPGK
ncbi:MAG TPA: hypothetical protein DCS60_02815 [Opitutae bacterium]|nr:hypothetical protein [Opitutae bacterium]